MPISDEYASTIVEVRAHFGFSNFACDPDVITTAPGAHPDEVGRRGAVRSDHAGHVIRWPFNSWCISSGVDSRDVNDHLRELIARLGHVTTVPPVFGEPSFGVLWKGNNLGAGTGPFFDADVIAGIARLRASLWQDIYQVDRDDPDAD